MAGLIIFLDDGGVISENHLRVPPWQRLVSEFFPPILGSTSQAWSEANRLSAPRQWTRDYMDAAWERAVHDYSSFNNICGLDWLTGMCKLVGVPVLPEQKALALAKRAADYVRRHLHGAFPGAAEAIRAIHARGHRLYVASGETSTDLAGYLDRMGVRAYFERLYGTDLVNLPKHGNGGSSSFAVVSLPMSGSTSAVRWSLTTTSPSSPGGVKTAPESSWSARRRRPLRPISCLRLSPSCPVTST